MLVHDFFQIDPEIASSINDVALSDYLIKHKDSLKHTSVSDVVVRRNMGRIDSIQFNAYDIHTYSPGKMRFFSSFLCYGYYEPMVGIDYYGITRLDTKILDDIIQNHGFIRLLDNLKLRKLIWFCKDAQKKGKWVIHYGV